MPLDIQKEAEEIQLFVVTREGVYRHEIVGIYDRYDYATEAALVAISEEDDDYHEFNVGKCTLGRTITDVENIAVFERKGEKISWR